MKTRAALTLSVLSLASMFEVGLCRALSLRSSSAEMALGDVRPGKISVVGVSGPLTVENAGAESVTLEVSASTPPPDRLKDGYDPLPDVARRVHVKGPSRPLGPGEKAEIAVTVDLSGDEGLKGGQYQFDCALKGRGSGASALSLRTAVTLSVGDSDPPEMEREPAVEGFSVSPAKARVEGVPLGKRAEAVSKTFRGLKLANASDAEVRVQATPVRSWDKSVRIEDGYTPAPNPRWLKTVPELRVKPGEVKEVTFALEIPEQARYLGRNWAFVVALDAAGGAHRARTWWTLCVRTQDTEVSRRR